MVYQKIFQIVRQKELSEDLAQEVFLKIWRKKSDLQINQSLEGYLATMAYHEALAHLRKKTPELYQIESELQENVLSTNAHLEIEAQDLQDRIERAINELPPRCRSVFVLSRYEGKSYKEIAELMEISIKTVENQMIKALSSLRITFKDLLAIMILLIIILL
ncbi:MAG: RNA polymerase sigma-70 factor [Saprospiraceae bacterium]|nr:RNA polymerase sigma-70 factor [Saprospiraceae bacterium]